MSGGHSYPEHHGRGETPQTVSETKRRHVGAMLKRFHDAALALPEPGAYPSKYDGYLRKHFPEEVHEQAFRNFLDRGIIENVGQVEPARSCHQYQIDPDAYEWVQRNLDEGPWPRCPHSGIANLGDGEYSCTNEHCDEVYERTDHEEVADE